MSRQRIIDYWMEKLSDQVKVIIDQSRLFVDEMRHLAAK